MTQFFPDWGEVEPGSAGDFDFPFEHTRVDRMITHLKQYAQYVRNTGQRPLPTAAFDEDWEPAGPMIRRQMVEAGLIEEWDGALMLTDKGEALLVSKGHSRPRTPRPSTGANR